MSLRSLSPLAWLLLAACGSSPLGPLPSDDDAGSEAAAGGQAGDGGQAGAAGQGGAAGSGAGAGGAAGAAQGGTAGAAGEGGAAGSCQPFSLAGRTWALTAIDPIGGAPIYPDVDLRKDGNPVAVFTKGNASSRYAAVSAFNGTSWSAPETIELVEGSYLGKRPSIAVESTGALNVVSYSEDDGDIRFASRPESGPWTVSTLYDSSADAGDHSSLFLEAGGRLHLTFLEYGAYRLIYGVRTAGVWSALQPVATTSGPVKGSSTSVGADAAGVPRVAYYAGTPSTDLRLARLAGAAWEEQVVDPTADTGHYPSLAVDAQGNEWIAYLRWPIDKSEIRVASRQSGTWHVRTVDTGLGITYTTGIALLPCGGIGAAWARNEGTGKQGLWFGYLNPGDALFTITSVDDSSYVSGIDMAADAQGRVHIVYLDETSYILKHAMLQ